MSEQRWTIRAAEDFSYTPAEIAQIGRAAQVFLDALQSVGGKSAYHSASLELGVLPGSVKVDWPQPDEFPVEPWTASTDPDWTAAQTMARRQSSPAIIDEPEAR